MKMPTPNGTQREVTSLADELARLEEIVRKLEAEDVELDTALALFEEGVARLRAARERLAQTELKVQSVLEAANGEIRVAQLDD
jgi:exodeoxyribonuclease VII small subunit